MLMSIRCRLLRRKDSGSRDAIMRTAISMLISLFFMFPPKFFLFGWIFVPIIPNRQMIVRL